MEVSCQIYVLAALLPVKWPFGAHWVGRWECRSASLDTLGIKRILMPLLGIEP